jgi:D-beta-D-heptose 7-phosphate kinase / D-beta-D-heptose 1-phosphate adenosyltransferase
MVDDTKVGSPFETVLAQLAARRILIVGDLMLDRFSYGSVGRISTEAPAVVINLNRVEEAVGGAGNVARNIASLGAHSDLLSVVGIDDVANKVCACLAELPNVEAHLIQALERVTTLKGRFVARLHNTHLLRADVEDASPISAQLADKLLRTVSELMPDVDAILLSDYGKGVLTDEVVRQIVALARQTNKIVVVDPKGQDYSRYAGANFLTPNLGELALAAGAPVDSEDDQLAAARQLIEMTGCDGILVTRGEHGVIVVTASGGSTSFAATARRVMDVSGAGDTLVAGFTLALACGASIMNAARLANQAAGIAVSKYGTASVTHQELEDALLSRPDFHITSKIFTDLSSLRRATAKWKEGSLIVGFTNGCFDVVHEGHVELWPKPARTATG